MPVCFKCNKIKNTEDFWKNDILSPASLGGRSKNCKECQPLPPKIITWVCVNCKKTKNTRIKCDKNGVCYSCINKASKSIKIKPNKLQLLISYKENYMHWKFKLPKFLYDILKKVPQEIVNRDYKLKQLRWLEYNPRRKARLLSAPTNFTYSKWMDKVNYYGWKCVYCGDSLSFKTLTMDHVKPLFLGGTHFISNLVPACWSCNGKKSIKLWKIKHRPDKGADSLL